MFMNKLLKLKKMNIRGELIEKWICIIKNYTC